MSDLEILKDESKSIDERIIAAESIARRYDEKNVSDKERLLFADFMRMDLSTLEKCIKGRLWTSFLKEAVVKGVYKYKLERLKESVNDMLIEEVGERFLKSRSVKEREILGKALRARADEIETMKLATAATIKNLEPGIGGPADLPYLSNAQISSVSKPSKRYAKAAFRTGKWKTSWGNPSDYGMDPKNEVRYVDKPANRDFAVLVYKLGLWQPEWGSPSEYEIHIS